MKLKRAIWIGVVTYILSFIIGLIPMILMGTDTAEISELPPSFFIIGIITSIVLAGLFTLVYFKDKGIKPSAKEGFYFGLVLIIVGFVLDVLIFSVSSLAADSEIDIFAYYSSQMFWTALVLLVAATTIIGAIKGRKKWR